jgi:outer membrane biosynthesis protein TonB
LTPSTGLLIVRITWIAAILVGVLAVLVGLLSGSDGDDSSGGSPETAFAPGFAFEAQQNAESPKTPAARDDRSRRAKGQLPGESRLTSGEPSGSADQPANDGGNTPVATPQPEPQPAPQPEPQPAPRPKPTPAPPQLPVSSQPAPPAPVEPGITVANNNDGP